MNRLQKLLSVENFQGIKDVILESPCFQLDHNGQVVRHVLVGITENELLIAIQEVCDFHKANLNPNTDLELDGLRLHSSIPLERVRFYVVDDRSRKFAICSCVGEVQYFEQCNTPDGSDAPWADWMEFISRQDDPRVFGYKIWNIVKNLYSDKHHFEFIKRPFPFYCVETVACQTIEIRTSRHQEHPLICYKNIKEDLASVKTKYGLEETTTVNDKLMVSSTKQSQPTKSNSCSTIREGCRISQNVRKFSLFGLMYQYCHGDKDRALYEFLDCYPNSKLPVEILRIYAQILKYQYREAQRLESGTRNEGSEESEASITDVIAGFKAEEKSVPPFTDESVHLSPKKWTLLRSKLLKTKIAGLPTLSQVVNDVLFEKCDSKLKQSSITSFSPFEVSKEIMLMTSECIVKITQMDITQLQTKKIPSSIIVLLEHFRLLSEIIKDDILDDTKFITKHQSLIFYIKVAKCCFDAGFLQTCEAIIIGITSPEVFALIRFWIALKQNAPKDLMSLYKMTNIIFIKDRYLKHIKQQATEQKVRFPLLDLFLQHAWNINPDMDRFLGYHNYKIPKGHILQKHVKFARVKSSTSNFKRKMQKSGQNHNKVDAKHTSSEVQTTATKNHFTTKPGKTNSVTVHHNEKESQNVRDSNSLEKEDVLEKQKHIAQVFCDQILTDALEILNDKSPIHNGNLKQESQNLALESGKAKTFEHGDSLALQKHKDKSSHISPQQLAVKTSGSFEHQDRPIPAPKTEFRRKKEVAKNEDSNIRDQQTNSKEYLGHNGHSTPETKYGNSTKYHQNTSRGEVSKVQNTEHKSFTEWKSDTGVYTETDEGSKKDPPLLDTSDPEDSQYFSTRHRQNINPERRLSLFADVSEHSLNQEKDHPIEEAIENNLGTFRKHSIFEDTYLDEEGETPKENRRPSLFNKMFSRSEKEKTRRGSFFENLIFHDGEKSFFQNYIFGDKSSSKNSSEDVSSNKEVEPLQNTKKEKKKKNVTFGEVNQVTYDVWSDHNMNSSSPRPTKPICGLCTGPCLFSEDLFQDVLRSQLLAITYINAHSPRLLLRRIINNKIKKCKQKIK